MFTRALIVIIVVYTVTFMHAQEVINQQLLRADKHYIKGEYTQAVKDYLEYLQDYPKEYYVLKQCARCYDKINDHYNAIDYWPLVVECSEVSDADFLDYAKCLLANNREADARKIFKHLSRSQNPVVSAWGRTYLQPAFGIPDSSSIKIFELKNVNSTAAEFSPVLYRDKLFFVVDNNPGALDFTARNSLTSQSIKIYIPRDSLDFLPSLLFEKIQAMKVQGQVCFSADGKWMYFSMNSLNPEPGRKNTSNVHTYQLYMLNLTTLNWPNPEVKSFEHNLAEFNSMHPSLSPDGQRLYFSSNRMGSLGGMDIFYCNKLGEGWTKPIPAGNAINTSGNEVFPYCSWDSLLYFSSDQRPGLGGLDIFSAKVNPDNQGFDRTQNCGAPFNSRYDDYGVFVIKGSNKGYFSSKRKSGNDEDLFFFSR